MENSKTEKICLIIIFNVLVPSLDQYTDISLARRLFMGPDDDLHVLSGKTRLHLLILTKYLISVIAFPYKQIFNGTFSDQSDTIQTMYRMVTILKEIFFLFTSYILVIYFFWDHGYSSNTSGSAIFMCDLL
jgi:hypothetical protein